jgi:heme O synthase-like polyprenyltransferase
MHQEEFVQQIGVSIVAAFVGIVFLWVGLRVRRHGEVSATARFTIAALGFAIAILVALRDLESIVAYSILCFSMATVYLADLLRDERAHRRRSALLSPRPAAEAVPAVWIVITLLATLTYVPYLIGGIDVVAASISFACAIATVAIAWRVATAPTQLTSADPQAEHICERADRARKAGLACVVTIGTIFCFVVFAHTTHATPPIAWGLGRITFRELECVWIGMGIWQTVYVWQVSRSGRSISA